MRLLGVGAQAREPWRRVLPTDPDAVVSQMDSTTSLQGRQTASWDGTDASWTYHPDNGLDLILTLSH